MCVCFVYPGGIYKCEIIVGGPNKNKSREERTPNGRPWEPRESREALSGRNEGVIGFNFRWQLLEKRGKESERERERESHGERAQPEIPRPSDDPDLALFHNDVTAPQQRREFPGGVSVAYIYVQCARPVVYSLPFPVCPCDDYAIKLTTGRGSLGSSIFPCSVLFLHVSSSSSSSSASALGQKGGCLKIVIATGRCFSLSAYNL